MERLLHYVWKNRLFPAAGLKTTDGEAVSVLSPGLHNKDAGPDFFSADIIIGGEDWMGNVEIHTRSTDWYRHGHERDAAYNNVVLHVVEQADGEVFTQAGRRVPQLVISVPERVAANYAALQAADDCPPCYDHAPQMPAVIRRQFMQRLAEARLERKAADMEARLQYCNRDWEHAFFITLARAFGFGVNSDTFEQWARTVPYGGAAKHRDNLQQILALFFGQAGFLADDSPYADQVAAAVGEFSVNLLKSEYKFLANKFTLVPMAVHAWRFLRTRPQNFPTVRIAQFARLYSAGTLRLAAVVEAASPDDARRLLQAAHLPAPTADLIVINAMVPALYAYGRYKGSARLCQKALRWLAELPAESNKYTRLWARTTLPVVNAADSQAVVQLVGYQCLRRDCLRCQLGHHYLKYREGK